MDDDPGPRPPDLEEASALAELLTAIFGIQWTYAVWFDCSDLKQVPCMTTEPFAPHGRRCWWLNVNIIMKGRLKSIIDHHWMADDSTLDHSPFYHSTLDPITDLHWKPRSDSTTPKASWPMITATVIKGVMWRQKMPVGQEGAWHRPPFISLSNSECRLMMNPEVEFSDHIQYEFRFDLGDEAYRQMMFDDTMSWTRLRRHVEEKSLAGQCLTV